MCNVAGLTAYKLRHSLNFQQLTHKKTWCIVYFYYNPLISGALWLGGTPGHFPVGPCQISL